MFVSPAGSAGISTGLFTESQAYFGVFQDVRANAVGNLNTTLDGQVSRGGVECVNTRASNEGSRRFHNH